MLPSYPQPTNPLRAAFEQQKRKLKIFCYNSLPSPKTIIMDFYDKFSALANRTRKSRYNIFPPTGTRAKYMSRVIKHNALPFMGNFCASSGDGCNPSDRAKFVSHCHTSARVQSLGSVSVIHLKK